MIRTGAWCVFVLLAAVCSDVGADEPSRAAVKKAAQQLRDSFLEGDYAKVIDSTYEPAVKELGGRETAIKTIEKGMKQMKAQGITFKSYRVGDPGELVTEGNSTYVVIPTMLEMTIPGGKAVAKSYLLGISPDKGETWKFIDGAGLAKKEARDKVLPKLPAKLKLPDNQQPEFIKDE